MLVDFGFPSECGGEFGEASGAVYFGRNKIAVGLLCRWKIKVPGVSKKILFAQISFNILFRKAYLLFFKE